MPFLGGQGTLDAAAIAEAATHDWSLDLGKVEAFQKGTAKNLEVLVDRTVHTDKMLQSHMLLRSLNP